jgi:branched-chain amino acid transport system substrate-binding protein
MKIQRKIILLPAIIALIFTACSKRNKSEERAEKAKHSNVIKIAVACPWKKLQGEVNLLQGIKLAVSEINKAGGVLNKQIDTYIEDDQSSLKTGRFIAQQFADDTDIVAVIGHYNSDISISASMIYEYNGILNINPWATDPKLTKSGLGLLFRTIPNTYVLAKKIGEISPKLGVKRVVIYNESRMFGYNIGNVYLQAAKDAGVVIVDRSTFEVPVNKINLEKQLKLWNDIYEFDAIMFAGEVHDAVTIINIINKLKMNTKILIGGDTSSGYLIKKLGNKSDGVYFCSIFDLNDQNKDTENFIKKYRKSYNSNPDVYAAEGYDAIMLLAEAIKNCGSIVPAKLASALRKINYEGVAGKISFDDKGELNNFEIIEVMEIKNGKVVPIF